MLKRISTYLFRISMFSALVSMLWLVPMYPKLILKSKILENKSSYQMAEFIVEGFNEVGITRGNPYPGSTYFNGRVETYDPKAIHFNEKFADNRLYKIGGLEKAYSLNQSIPVLFNPNLPAFEQGESPRLLALDYFIKHHEAELLLFKLKVFGPLVASLFLSRLVLVFKKTSSKN